MKQKNIIVISAIALAIISGIFIYLFDVGLFAVTQETSQTQEYFFAPAFGYAACQQETELSYYPSRTTYEDFDGFEAFSCNSFGSLLQECTFTIRSPSDDEVGGLGTQDAFIAYRICDENDNTCLSQSLGTGTILWVKENFFRGDFGYLSTENIKVLENQVLRIGYFESGTFSGIVPSDAVAKGDYQISFRPYFLYKYDTFSPLNGMRVTDTPDCTPSGEIQELNFILEDITRDGQLSQDLDDFTLASTANALRIPGARVPFMSVEGVAVIPLASTYEDGQQLFCKDKRLYKVERLTTEEGTFDIAQTSNVNYVRNVDCCTDGDLLDTTKKCIDFEEYTIEEVDEQGLQESCTLDVQCQTAIIPISSDRSGYEECVNNVCQTQFITGIDCNFDEDCDGGVCEVDPTNPRNNYCRAAERIDVCGDGFCALSFGENEATCPEDCSKDVSPTTDTTLVLLIIASAVMLLIIVVVLRRGGGKKAGPISLN